MKWVECLAGVATGVRRALLGCGAAVLGCLITTAGDAAETAGDAVLIQAAAGPAGQPPREALRRRGLDRPESIFGREDPRVPEVAGGQFQLPELMAPTTDTAEIGDGSLPAGFRGEQPAPRRPLPESLAERGFAADWKMRRWAAPNTFANPRYFEDRMLERHGHQRFGHFQPLASGVRFFATVPMLPYLSTVRPPWECEYTLGYYRVGSCVPRFLQRPPYERRAALVEASSIAGAILAFP